MEQEETKKIFKNKGDEIAATGTCGEGSTTPNQYSTILPEDQAKQLIDTLTTHKIKTNEDVEKIETPEFDKRITDHIKKIDSIPNPDKEPCEESEQMCEMFTKGRQKAQKIIETQQYRLDNMETELNFKLTIKEKEQIREKANKYGFKNLSDYMRVVLLNAKLEITQDNNTESLKSKYDDEKYGDLYYFMDKFIKDPSDMNYRRLVLLFDSMMVYKLNKPKE